ncbi:hypothetical protein PV326_009262 [Microctonus aethiopoides]|nr:hypothetical protein PV326_009262 [Microctonus aethiopoides]
MNIPVNDENQWLEDADYSAQQNAVMARRDTAGYAIGHGNYKPGRVGVLYTEVRQAYIYLSIYNINSPPHASTTTKLYGHHHHRRHHNYTIPLMFAVIDMAMSNYNSVTSPTP